MPVAATAIRRGGAARGAGPPPGVKPSRRPPGERPSRRPLGCPAIRDAPTGSPSRAPVDPAAPIRRRITMGGVRTTPDGPALRSKERLDRQWLEWSERRDLNSRPPVPQTGALTGLRYAPSGRDYRDAAGAAQPGRGAVFTRQGRSAR